MLASLPAQILSKGRPSLHMVPTLSKEDQDCLARTQSDSSAFTGLEDAQASRVWSSTEFC